MMGCIPASFLVVVLEHGKISHPEQAEVVFNVAISFKGLVTVGVSAPQFETCLAGRSVLGFFVSLGPSFWSAIGRRNSNHRDNQIFGIGGTYLPNPGRDLRMLLFQLNEIVKHSNEIFVSLGKFFSQRA